MVIESEYGGYILEIIRTITSVSHSGLRRMWYPFSTELDRNNSVISAENYYEIAEFFDMIKSMFATNNHSPQQATDKNYKNSREFLIGGERKKTVCSILFKTDSNTYILKRCFHGVYSIEASIKKSNSSIIYYGEDAIKMLSKFQKPFIISEGSFGETNSPILKPDSDFSRSSLLALTNTWARMIGLFDSKLNLDYNGRWSMLEDNEAASQRIFASQESLSPHLRVLSHLSQAVMRKRRYGKCQPVFTPFNVDRLNSFEAIAVLDLIKNVSIEENLQFIVGINSKPEINSMIEVTTTPDLAIYRN